jgi:hypothetical protein
VGDGLGVCEGGSDVCVAVTEGGTSVRVGVIEGGIGVRVSEGRTSVGVGESGGVTSVCVGVNEGVTSVRVGVSEGVINVRVGVNVDRIGVLEAVNAIEGVAEGVKLLVGWRMPVDEGAGVDERDGKSDGVNPPVGVALETVGCGVGLLGRAAVPVTDAVADMTGSVSPGAAVWVGCGVRSCPTGIVGVTVGTGFSISVFRFAIRVDRSAVEPWSCKAACANDRS